MNEIERLKAELTGTKAAVEFQRLDALEWKRRTAMAEYNLASARLENLKTQIDIQREFMGLDPEPGCENIRKWRNRRRDE
jgi:hypothetical protein